MKIIACYSNKGGVGKTASSVNLAYAGSACGQRILLCDLDSQGASSFYFRIKPSTSLKDKAFFNDADSFVKSIRASDYDNLDLLPANMSFRDFDIFLARMKNSRSRLKKALKAVNNEYDMVILDCPPNISRLSENIFKVADKIIVPVIPTTLSERTLDQLYKLFGEQGYQRKKIIPFFSMVQKQKKLHRQTMLLLKKRYPAFLKYYVPSSTDVEKMGIYRAPLLTFSPRNPASLSYLAIWQDIAAKL